MRAIGTDNIWFSFKGVRNDEHDVRMLSMPKRPHPARKGKAIDIPGANGKLWQDQGSYDNIVIAIRVISGDNSNIDDISAWLSGQGDLVFGDEPDRVYHARISREFSRTNRSQRLRGQEFTIMFDCEPFRYNLNAETDTVTLTGATGSVTNPGTEYSEPLIVVTGSGNVDVQIGSNTLLFSDLSASKPIFVDCAAKIAYTGEGAADKPMMLATQNVTGEWVRIQPGHSFVSISGAFTSVVIYPRWRWL